jgi:hypothetical protein
MTDMRVILGIVAAAGVAIGLVLGSLLRGNPDPQPPSPASNLSIENAARIDAELAAIRDDLAFERDARIALEENMERQIDALQNPRAPSRSKPAKPKPPKRASQRTAPEEADLPFPKGWFSISALLEIGVHREDIARLQERFEAVELEKRELRNRGTREGFASRMIYGKQARELSQRLREDVGDEDYDRILYASGQNNRVRAETVSRESAAARAGIRAGDVIVRYAGERIFDQESLLALTADARLSENIGVEVLRNGEIIYLDIPGGPFGIAFAHIQIPPGS